MNKLFTRAHCRKVFGISAHTQIMCAYPTAIHGYVVHTTTEFSCSNGVIHMRGGCKIKHNITEVIYWAD